MYPLFIIDDPNEEQAINAMPGVSRFGINKMMEHVQKLVPLGKCPRFYNTYPCFSERVRERFIDVSLKVAQI